MTGEVWAILASGPSLTAEDAALIERSGVKVIAVNTTWKMARFCDVIYAGDRKWWYEYGSEIDIPAKGVTYSQSAAKKFGLKHHRFKLKNGYNSGMLAIDYAVSRGASKVILLGYDCSIKNGIHHHGPHKKTHNPTTRRCRAWHEQFEYLAKKLKGADIVNCSRYTELEVFPVAKLEDVLCGLTSTLDTTLKAGEERTSADLSA
jgi:hypothetical protein